MAKSSSNINKRSIATYSAKERKESRAKAMKDASSSKDAATRFLQKAGILDNKGKISEYYR